MLERERERGREGERERGREGERERGREREREREREGERERDARERAMEVNAWYLKIRWRNVAIFNIAQKRETLFRHILTDLRL